jgi:hypothetical protein
MIDRIRARYERAEVGELDGSCRVEHDSDLPTAISRVVAEAIVQRLHRVPDLMRVEEVDKHALAGHRLRVAHRAIRADDATRRHDEYDEAADA